MPFAVRCRRFETPITENNPNGRLAIWSVGSFLLSFFFAEQRKTISNTDRKAAKTGITERKGIKIAPEHLKNGAPARNFDVFSSILVRFGAL